MGRPVARILSPFRSLYRRFGPGGCLLLTVGLGVATLLATTSCWYWRVSRQEAEELARLKDAGEPATLAELDVYYSRTAGQQDLTASWLAALEPLDGSSDGLAEELRLVGAERAKTPLPGQPWPEIDAARNLLAKYGSALRDLHAAARRHGDARYDVDLTRGMFSPLPHHGLIRQGIRLLTFEAGLRAYEGNVAACIEALHAAYALGRTLRREPIGLSLLVRIGCDGAAREQLRRLLPNLDCSPDQLMGLRADVRAIDYAEGLQRALVGERVLGLAAFRDPSILNEPSEQGGFATIMKVLSFGDLPRFLRYMDRLRQAARLPPPANLQAAEEIDRELRDLFDDRSAWGPMRHFLLKTHLQLKCDLFRAAVRAEAWSRCADATLAVEQFRREAGRLPTSLDELVPRLLDAIPTDPFDGERLRYAIMPSGYRLYSVGPDRIDQGGTSDDSSTPPDLTFDVEIKQNADDR
ncbi:MAG TPA: hypothetical protein VG125_33120 [Pirellulales bacterium]|jgi:hypothetical protein|nr:hypothetical protein [Pirellulales bacterium]